MTEGQWRNPTPTVDILIEYQGGIVLIERRHTPLGWALPGGFVDEWETVEQAAIREAKEETSLDVTLVDLLWVYSHPGRDARKHTMSTVYVGRGEGILEAADDAGQARILTPDEALPELVFDHRWIVEDYRRYRVDGTRPTPAQMLARLKLLAGQS